MGEKLCELLEHDGVTHRGWMFYCPACKAYHQTDNRWVMTGTKEAPTFDGSVLQFAATHGTSERPIHRPRCHLYVTNGKIVYLDDCEHNEKNTIVDMVDWDDKTKEVR